MIEVASKLICVVTTSVSFLYATTICWKCGNQCTFDKEPNERKRLILSNLPLGFAIYAFGFFVIFTCAMDGALIISAAYGNSLQRLVAGLKRDTPALREVYGADELRDLWEHRAEQYELVRTGLLERVAFSAIAE